MAKHEVNPVQYETLSPGYEAVSVSDPGAYTPGTDGEGPFDIDLATTEGPTVKWTTWPMTLEHGRVPWTDEIRVLNEMQSKLGTLGMETRRLRAHIGSLVPCDSGFPVTVDELLSALGRGRLYKKTFHNGCWAPSVWWEERTTQPGQQAAMLAIEDIVRGYVSGVRRSELTDRYPQAGQFIARTCDWLGPAEQLSPVQHLMIERFLLPFEYFTRRTHDWNPVYQECFGEDGRGQEIDTEITRLAGLPRIRWNNSEEFKTAHSSIEGERKKNLYEVCGALAISLHTLSDCHHSSFRYVETWLHGIGRGKLQIPGRSAGTERRRLGRLLFGYALALDRWLQGVSMQWLLMDLGHVDLGFDPKNEILRVYAYLGERRSPTREWLTACLWYNIARSWPAGLDCGRSNHPELLATAEASGIVVNEWMSAKLQEHPPS
jgi:hypothetical protein